MMSPAPRLPSSSCPGCDTGHDRREFLREITAILSGVAGTLRIGPLRAAALSVAFTPGLSVRGEEVTYGIPASNEVMIDKAHEVILVRNEESVYAFSLSCPHEKTPLRWKEESRRFECPKHKSRFEPDGAFVDGRATRDMDRYRIRREAETVVVDLSKLYRDDENREDWIAAVVRL